MKILKLVFLLIILFLYTDLQAQCLSGDCKNGYGEYKYDNGKYKGDYKDGVRHGTGTYYYDNGDKYVGEWENDKKNGTGTYYLNNGDKYKGEFKDGLKHGYGDYTYKNGAVKSGKWVDGKCQNCYTDKPKNTNNQNYNNKNNSGPPKQQKPVGTNPTVVPGRY